MFFRNAFHTLVKLYSEGGIEICTPFNTSGKDGRGNKQPLLARTVIQPDADVIMFVSERILVQPEIWQEHLDKLKNKLSWIRHLRWFLRWVRLFSPVFLLLGGSSFREGQFTWFILFFSLSLFFPMMKPLVGFWFKQRLRRELNRV